MGDPPAPGRDLDELQHPRFARVYPWISRWVDEHGGLEHRKRLLAPLSGDVLEVGAGNGRNFPHYPPAVTSVLAVEPEAGLREQAERATRGSPIPVRVVAGRAEHLPAEDTSMDAVVVSLVLCSINDPTAALAEVRRVLRPGGTLRFYEHVRAAGRATALLQDAVTPLWSRVTGGCHLNRDTEAVLRAAGFDITEIERFRSAGAPHILGTARRTQQA